MSDFQINLITLNKLKSQTIDGCIFVSSNAQQIFEDFMSRKRIHININGIYKLKVQKQIKTILINLDIPVLNLYSQFDSNSISNIPNDQLRSSLEEFLSNSEFPNKAPKSINLRILLCFMCGGDKNDIESFFSQLSSRFSLIITHQSSFMINTFLDQSNRKVKKLISKKIVINLSIRLN